jgi:alpha-glucosidase (family GH31 glycosyl hydrolase)
MWHAWERIEECTRFWWESPKERDHLKDQGVDGIRMDLRETGSGGCGLDSTGSGQGPVVGCCECGDEPSGSCAADLVIVFIFIYFICFVFNLFNLMYFD